MDTDTYTRTEIIELGTNLGLKHYEPNHYIEHDVIFLGCNGQSFMIHVDKPKHEVLKQLGNAIFLFGKRTKCMELHNVISITKD